MGLGDMKKKALETSISQAEEQVGTMAPGYLKCFFPMCGGPVGTLSKFECAFLRTRRITSPKPRTPTPKRRMSSRRCELAARKAVRVRSPLSERLLPSCFKVVLLHSRLLQQRSASPYYSSCGGRASAAWFQLRAPVIRLIKAQRPTANHFVELAVAWMNPC